MSKENENYDIFESSKKTVTIAIATVIMLLFGFSFFSWLNNKPTNNENVIETVNREQEQEVDEGKKEITEEIDTDNEPNVQGLLDEESKERIAQISTENQETKDIEQIKEEIKQNIENKEIEGEGKESNTADVTKKDSKNETDFIEAKEEKEQVEVTENENENESLLQKAKNFFNGNKKESSIENDNTEVTKQDTTIQTQPKENNNIEENKEQAKLTSQSTPQQSNHWTPNKYSKGDISMEKQTYTVVKGDTLWEISKGLNGTGNNWHNIAKNNNISYLANGNPLIIPGQTLNLK